MQSEADRGVVRLYTCRDCVRTASGISKNTYYRWRRAGDALYHGEECKDIPHFKPRQLDETDAEFEERRAGYQETCDMLEDLFLSTMETLAEARYQLHKRMYERAMKDKEYVPNAWMLERTVPEHYALVATNRREVDVKAEITHKHEVELLAEAFAVLGRQPLRQAPVLPEDGETETEDDVA